MSDVGLYIHVPFCASKCGYCDFYSTVPLPGAFEPLVDALITELDAALTGRCGTSAPPAVETIFVGGGTPSLLPTALLVRLFTRLRRVVEEHKPVEFTVECNPASLTDAKADLLRRAGVNRISMGAQSFHPQELRVLERIHNPADIPASAAIVRRSGFAHFNLDLIFGIPGQTLASWKESIRRAIELGPDHLACYGLTFEPDTPLDAQRRAGLITPMDEDLQAELYLATLEELAAAGFEQYEISNFARPGARCLHNLRYWHNRPGIGIGPSAASYLDGRRWRNIPDTGAYVHRVSAGLPIAIDEEQLDPLARAGETAMLRLRTMDGIDRQAFRQATGFDPHELFAATIDRHRRAGLLTVDNDRIALTSQALLVADAIMADFLAPAATDVSARPVFTSPI